MEDGTRHRLSSESYHTDMQFMRDVLETTSKNATALSHAASVQFLTPFFVCRSYIVKMKIIQARSNVRNQVKWQIISYLDVKA